MHHKRQCTYRCESQRHHDEYGREPRGQLRATIISNPSVLSAVVIIKASRHIHSRTDNLYREC